MGRRMKHGDGKPQAPTTRPAAPTTGGSSPAQSSARELAGRRYGTGASLQSPNAARPELPPPARVSTSNLNEAVGRLHAQHGEQIQRGSLAVGVPAAATAAVILAEHQFAPTAVDDRMAIRFEPYAFFQQTGRWLVATHKDQAAEYRAFGEAQAIDPAAAHTSVRMGMGQVSGAEAGAAGFESAESMLTALQRDPDAQLSSLFNVIAADESLRSAMGSEDWRQVASMRAGPGFGALGFDEALAACAEAWRKVERGGGDDEDESDAPKKPKARKKREA